MHKGPIDHRHTLKHILQALPQVMTIPDRRLLIQDNIDLHIQLVAHVVRLQALDLLDGLSEAHGEVEEHVALVGGGCCAGEVADVRGGGD